MESMSPYTTVCCMFLMTLSSSHDMMSLTVLRGIYKDGLVNYEICCADSFFAVSAIYELLLINQSFLYTSESGVSEVKDGPCR